MDQYAQLYRDSSRRLRLPFAHVGTYLAAQGVRPSAAERRAIVNASQGLVSLSIFAGRLRGHLEKYRPDSLRGVPFYELFLDTQTLFLFAQQYLADLAHVLRMALPKADRHQTMPKFGKLSLYLRRKLSASDR